MSDMCPVKVQLLGQTRCFMAECGVVSAAVCTCMSVQACHGQLKELRGRAPQQCVGSIAALLELAWNASTHNGCQWPWGLRLCLSNRRRGLLGQTRCVGLQVSTLL